MFGDSGPVPNGLRSRYRYLRPDFTRYQSAQNSRYRICSDAGYWSIGNYETNFSEHAASLKYFSQKKEVATLPATITVGIKGHVA